MAGKQRPQFGLSQVDLWWFCSCHPISRLWLCFKILVWGVGGVWKQWARKWSGRGELCVECCKGKAEGKHSAVVGEYTMYSECSPCGAVVVKAKGRRILTATLGQHAMDRHRSRRGIGQDIAMPNTVWRKQEASCGCVIVVTSVGLTSFSWAAHLMVQSGTNQILA